MHVASFFFVSKSENIGIVAGSLGIAPKLSLQTTARSDPVNFIEGKAKGQGRGCPLNPWQTRTRSAYFSSGSLLTFSSPQQPVLVLSNSAITWNA